MDWNLCANVSTYLPRLLRSEATKAMMKTGTSCGGTTGTRPTSCLSCLCPDRIAATPHQQEARQSGQPRSRGFMSPPVSRLWDLR